MSPKSDALGLRKERTRVSTQHSFISHQHPWLCSPSANKFSKCRRASQRLLNATCRIEATCSLGSRWKKVPEQNFFFALTSFNRDLFKGSRYTEPRGICNSRFENCCFETGHFLKTHFHCFELQRLDWILF